MEQIKDVGILILLLVDVVVIYFVAREIIALRKTDKTLVDTHGVLKDTVTVVSSSVRLLQRDMVYYYLAKTASEAEKHIHHLSVAQSTAEISDKDEKQRVMQFLQGLETAKMKGVEIRILGPEHADKVGGLYERKALGAEVKVSSEVTSWDVRIQIVDGERVVIGVGPPEQRSEQGFLFQSYKLAQILDAEFRSLWDERAKHFDEHLQDVVVRHTTGLLTVHRLCQILMHNLNLPSDRVVRDMVSMLLRDGHLLEVGDKVCSSEYIVKAFGDQLSQGEVPSAASIRSYLEERGVRLAQGDETTVHRFLAAKVNPAGSGRDQQ